MHSLYLGLALITATLLCTAVVSKSLEKSVLQAPLVAMMVGIMVGPQGTGWIDLGLLENPIQFIEEFARITLAIALMGVALRLRRREIVLLRYPAAILISLGMTGMWLSAWLLAAWLLSIPWMTAAVIAAVVAATDPVVASAIVTGPLAQKHLPARVRATLSLESGANDGLAYLIVVLPILLIAHDTAHAWSLWFIHALLIGVLIACLIGAGIGYVAARLLHWTRQSGFMEHYSYLTFTLAVSLFTLSIGHLTGAESLISVFVAGLVFDMFSETSERHDEENVQEAVSKLCTLPMFIILGAALPMGYWVTQGWPLAAFCIAALFLRRMPVVLALGWMLKKTFTKPDMLFIGWFGPVGAAAVFYAAYATRRTGLDVIWHSATALIFASVLAHGLTAAPLTRLYAKYGKRLN
jgi:sodium/hydrogen antiporter